MTGTAMSFGVCEEGDCDMIVVPPQRLCHRHMEAASWPRPETETRTEVQADG